MVLRNKGTPELVYVYYKAVNLFVHNIKCKLWKSEYSESIDLFLHLRRHNIHNNLWH